MPKINQDLPNPKKKSTQQLCACRQFYLKPGETKCLNCQKVSSSDNGIQDDIGGLKLATYGRGKTGKTRLACSFPKPLLLIGTEDGTKSIKTGKKKLYTLSTGNDVWELYRGQEPTGVHFVKINEVQELRECTDILKNPDRIHLEDDSELPSYRSVALDHGGGLQALLVKEYKNLDEVLTSNAFGMLQTEEWGAINLLFSTTVGKLLDLADTHDINVVIVAHERNFKETENRDDLIQPMVSAALTPGSCNWLNGACDYFCQMLIRQKYRKQVDPVLDSNQKPIIDKDTGKPLTTTVLVPIKGVDYCLRVGAHAVYQTGFRTVLEGDLPDVIVNPNYEKIVQVIRGELPDDR